MKVYLDNAATTPIDPVVFEEMKPYFLNHFGNPSSIHAHGREVRSAIEKSRKKIADLLNTSPSEIFFTSGGTEADNTVICCTVDTYDVEHIISSKIEHHAVLHTIENLEKIGKVRISYLEVDEQGNHNYDQLEDLLKKNPNSLVSIMHANNEIGNLNDIGRVGEMCAAYGSYFHSDSVQTMGHYVHDLQKLNIHSIAGSAHKFHGPKGIGFMFVRNDFKINPFIHGGGQERNMRGGTENVYGIVGLAKALEIAYHEMDSHQKLIQGLKDRMISKLKASIEDISFNGECANNEKSLYTILNVCLPESGENDMLLFNLDINQISASGGSACSSGSDIGSHVLKGIKTNPNRGAIRFSFSKYNNTDEIDYTVEKLASFYTITA